VIGWAWEGIADGSAGCGVSDDEDRARLAAEAWLKANPQGTAVLDTARLTDGTTTLSSYWALRGGRGGCGTAGSCGRGFLPCGRKPSASGPARARCRRRPGAGHDRGRDTQARRCRAVRRGAGHGNRVQPPTASGSRARQASQPRMQPPGRGYACASRSPRHTKPPLNSPAATAARRSATVGSPRTRPARFPAMKANAALRSSSPARS
jgi:hypothetical protein